MIYFSSLQNHQSLLMAEHLASNNYLPLTRLYTTICLTLRTTRAKPPHHPCGASTRYVRSLNTSTKNPHKKISVIPFRIPQILNIIDNSNVSELVCVWSATSPQTNRSLHDEILLISRIWSNKISNSILILRITFVKIIEESTHTT